MEQERILYLECNSGISGDMTVGALLDLGASREELEKALDSLGVGGYHLHFGRTKKCGIDAFDFDVHLEREGHEHEIGHVAGPAHEHCHESGHVEGHAHEHCHESGHVEGHAHEHCHESGHVEGHAHEHCREHGFEAAHYHVHDHGHPHPHEHRHLSDILEIIGRLEAGDPVKDLARRIFEIVAEAESKAHGIPVEEVHFHEVGAVDSIVDIIGTAVCLDSLGVSKVIVSPLAEGRGYVRCQHGVMPVPVPATANIAAAHGLELRLTENEGEMVTPTGAAIAAALHCGERLPSRYHIKKIGIGAGNKDFANANILRAMLIEPIKEDGPAGETEPAGLSGTLAPAGEILTDEVMKLETNLDDCTGEALGFVMEELLKAGAADVWHTPIFMKKGRPAYLLSVLCRPGLTDALEAVIFRHTTTIGIRKTRMERTVLQREIREVPVEGGVIQVKVCQRDGKPSAYPEYESVSRLCKERGTGFSETYFQAKAAAEERTEP